MQLDARKVQAAADIIRDSAIEFLANKHLATPALIRTAIVEGDTNIRNQFDTLVRAAIAEAQRLASDGRISFAPMINHTIFNDLPLGVEFDFEGVHYFKTSGTTACRHQSGSIKYFNSHDVVEVK